MCASTCILEIIPSTLSRKCVLSVMNWDLYNIKQPLMQLACTHNKKRAWKKKNLANGLTFQGCLKCLCWVEDRTKTIGMLNWKGFIFQLLPQQVDIYLLSAQAFLAIVFQGTFMLEALYIALNSTSPWPTCSSLEPSKPTLFHLQCGAVKYLEIEDQAFHHLNMLSVITRELEEGELVSGVWGASQKEFGKLSLTTACILTGHIRSKEAAGCH